MSQIAVEKRAMWFTWTPHRRSSELARALDVELREIVFRGPRPIRHLLASIVTIATIASKRPRVVFVQNPSILLAAIACAFKTLLRYRVVVDRHSNFTFEDTDTGLFNLVSNYSLKRADLTIVTNDYVKQLVHAKGGRAIILPDKLPTFTNARVVPNDGSRSVVFVCTYSDDEPIEEVIEAARLLGPDVRVHITGNYLLLSPEIRQSTPPNVVFTGFLPTADYEALLASADLVLELTTRDHTLLCGAYEAVSAGTPLVISRTEALMRYFRRGAVVTDNHAEAIAAAITTAIHDLDRLKREVAEFRLELQDEWSLQFRALGRQLTKLGFPCPVIDTRHGRNGRLA